MTVWYRYADFKQMRWCRISERVMPPSTMHGAKTVLLDVQNAPIEIWITK